MITIFTAENWTNLTESPANQAVEEALKKVHAAKTISAQFDALINLIEECHKYLDENPKNVEAKTLKENAIEFAQAIVDAKDFNELKKKVTERRKNRKTNPDFMPWPTPSTELKSTDCALLNENDRIFISQGQFKKITKNKDGSLTLSNFNTAIYSDGKENDLATIVISPKGDIYAIDSAKIHNVVNFLKISPAFYAGEMTISDGVISEITNLLTDNSQYFSPTLQENVEFISFLQENNLLKQEQEIGLTNQPLYEEEVELKTNVQLINYYANPFFKQFKKDGDMASYLNYKNNLAKKVKDKSREELQNELPDLVKKAYAETVIDKTVIDQVKDYFKNPNLSDEIVNSYVDLSKILIKILANKYFKLKKYVSMKEFNDHLNDSSSQISLKIIPIIQSIFEGISHHANFILVQNFILYQRSFEDVKDIINTFSRLVFKEVIKHASQGINFDLEDIIFQLKINMAIKLHMIANEDMHDNENDQIYFSKQVKTYIKQAVSSNNTKDDQYIVEGIEHAKIQLSTKKKQEKTKANFFEEKIKQCEASIEEESKRFADKPVQQAQFVRLANKLIQKKIDINCDSVETIKTKLNSIFNSIGKIISTIENHSQFIIQSVEKLGQNGKIFAIEFINQTADRIAEKISNDKALSPTNLDDIIFNAKINVLTESYVQKLSTKYNPVELEMFRKRATESILKNEEARKDDQFILAEIVNAKNFLMIEFPLFDSLMKKIDKLRSVNTPASFQTELDEKVGLIYKKIGNIEKITSIDKMQEEYTQLSQEVKTAHEFYHDQMVRFRAAKLDLAVIINQGQRNFAHGKQKELANNLEACSSLSAIVTFAEASVLTSIIENRSFMSMGGLFANPAKFKPQVIAFVEKYQKLVPINERQMQITP